MAPSILPPFPAQLLRTPAAARQGFSLVELLAVIGIMLLIIGLGVRHSGDMRAADVSRAAYEVAEFFQQAKAYAAAYNTYVWVGVAEVDATQNAGAVPQAAGVGRVMFAAVASKDGTKIYNETNPDWTAVYNSAPTGSRWAILGKPVRLDNFHLIDVGFPAQGALQRAPVAAECRLGNSDVLSTLNFSYPVSKPIGSGQYLFKKVVQFDPQGAVRIISGADSVLLIPERLEIALQRSNGNIAQALPADPNKGEHFVIQMDGLTGAVKMFRP